MRLNSIEALDATAAEVVRLKIFLTEMTAAKDAKVADLQQKFDEKALDVRQEIAGLETDCRQFCEAHRQDPALFGGNKSRETSLCTMGFRTTPPKVATSSRRIKWADVITRLKRLAWGAAYLRTPEPSVDKEALLADRERLTDAQREQAGIRFEQDEIFFLEPKPETAQIVK